MLSYGDSMGTTYSAGVARRAAVDCAGTRWLSLPPGLAAESAVLPPAPLLQAANPIALFEHLTKTYGRMAHYRLGLSHIVFINEPTLS